MQTGTILIKLEAGKVPVVEIRGDVRAKDIPMLQRRIFQEFRIYSRAGCKARVAAKAEERRLADLDQKQEDPVEEVKIEQTTPNPQFVPRTTFGAQAPKPAGKEQEANNNNKESEVSDAGSDNTRTTNASSEGSGDSEGSSTDS